MTVCPNLTRVRLEFFHRGSARDVLPERVLAVARLVDRMDDAAPLREVVRHTPFSSTVTEPPLTSATTTPTVGMSTTRSNSWSLLSSVRRTLARIVQSSGARSRRWFQTSRSDSVSNCGSLRDAVCSHLRIVSANCASQPDVATADCWRFG